MLTCRPRSRRLSSASALCVAAWALFVVDALSWSFPAKSSFPNARSRLHLTRRQYANTVDPPLPQAGPKSTLQRALRDIIVPPATSKKPRKSAHFVQEISTLQEFKQAVVDEPHRMIAVRFHAPWCQACKAMTPVYYRMAQRQTQAKFMDVSCTDQNVHLHQGLGIPAVPYGHIYHPTAGLVEELRLNKNVAKAFEQILQSYVQGYCELPSDVDPAKGVFSAPYQRS